MEKRIALFAGPLDPYTNGHHDIVRKATGLFDEVVVLIGVNVNKRRFFDAEAMHRAIQQAIDADGLNARSVIHTGLVADYCAAHGIRWYVRGLRNEMDAIASCFIGGASAYGGIGKVSGMIIGALLMGVINKGMMIVGVDANYQKVVKGIVLLIAVMFDVLSKRQKR